MKRLQIAFDGARSVQAPSLVMNGGSGLDFNWSTAQTLGNHDLI